ncbi:MAG: M20/M25/M40 family metallo-hydrolase [Bacteroidales bacterium]|nr:M20/M25/M40 family metallo-hydrolase [Bacteroidales bacterium]
MFYRIGLAFFLISAFFLVRAQDTTYLRYSLTITKEELSAHVYKLASEEFSGRYTGSKGEYEAGKYILEEFAEDGLQAPVINGKVTYRQVFALDNCRWKDQRLMVNGGELKVGRDFLFLSDPVDIKGNFPVIFAGFGIEDKAYSDFSGLDVKGKILLVFSGEPRDKKGRSVITGKEEQSKKGYYFSKAALATAKGAAGVIIIARKDSDFRDFLKNRDQYETEPNISYPEPGEEDVTKKEVFSAFVDLKTAAMLVGEKPAVLSAAMKEMESSLATAAGRFAGRVEIDASSDCVALPTANIVAIVEGSEKKHEAVVVVAHYDHLGEFAGDIYYGADDNASGTAAVMELAEAFSRAVAEGVRPKRTVIFLAVSAEELGLYGSRHYTDHPLIPLDSTVACINIDMIGRSSEKQVTSDYISGYVYRSPELYALTQHAHRLAAPGLLDRMELRQAVRGGSDHYYFAKHGIPSVFYFTGFHEDYHEPTDTPDKILYTRMEQIVRAIFAVTWKLANGEEKMDSE